MEIIAIQFFAGLACKCLDSLPPSISRSHTVFEI